MNRVLLSGASGLIGAALAASFEQAGVEVVRLVRGPAQGPGQISWDPMAEVSLLGSSSVGTAVSGLAPSAVSRFDAVIHLSGESIVGRWTAAKKRAIRESRVRSTRNLATALARTEEKPSVFVCASGVGFYGNRGDEILTEGSSSGEGFLAEVCREWEDASQIAAQAGIRTVTLRIGPVLSGKGGALEKMLTPFKLGLGGRIGSGKQWWCWIHMDDIVGAVRHVLETESVSGPVNTVAPNVVRNAEFTKILASVLGRPAIFPVPGFALGIAFGRMAADELFLASQRVEPRKLTASGYRFRFADLRGALEDLVGE